MSDSQKKTWKELLHIYHSNADRNGDQYDKDTTTETRPTKETHETNAIQLEKPIVHDGIPQRV